jgi:hypothetical protein
MGKTRPTPLERLTQQLGSCEAWLAELEKQRPPVSLNELIYWQAQVRRLKKEIEVLSK